MVRLSLLILFPFHFNEWPFHRPEGVENEKCHYFHLKKKKKISLSWLWIKVNHNIERPLMLILAAGLDSRYLWSCSFLWLQTLMTLKSCPWCQQQLMNRNLALVCDASDEDLWQQSRADCTPWCWLQQQSATGTTWNGCPSLWVDNLLLASTNFSHLWSVIGRWCQRWNQWPTHRYIFFQMIRNIISIALSRQIRIAATRGERRFFFKMKISGSRPAHLSAANQLLAFFMFSLLTLCMLPFHGSQIPRVRERGAKAESHHHHFNIITSHRQINSVRQPK